MAIESIAFGDMLQKTCNDLPIFDRFRRAALDVEESQKRRVGPTAAEAVEALFPAPQSGQPIVDEDDSPCVHAPASATFIGTFGDQCTGYLGSRNAALCPPNPRNISYA